MSKRALITGSGGLIGSACVGLLADRGWQVIGVDNNMREVFFGPQGSTAGVVKHLSRRFKSYRHYSTDIRDRQGIRDLMAAEKPDFIIHTAGQPSHDRAAAIPYEDFDVNAVGTLNLLVAARDYCADAPFSFTSTNKVYGDRPNSLPLVESESRYDYADGRQGIDETMPIDNCLHSLFGASKVAADIMCQEFGKYFSMPVGIFRGGCLTGPQHAAVEMHGYLAYIVACALSGKEYTVIGYKGKQVRDQIHCDDVTELFLEFLRRLAAARSTTSAAGGKTASRFWKRLPPSRKWVSTCGIHSRMKIGWAITSATLLTCRKSDRISRSGGQGTIWLVSYRRS